LLSHYGLDIISFMHEKKGVLVTFLDQTELSDDQISKTRDAYEINADKYVLNYERRLGALDEARLFTLDPFLKLFQSSGQMGKILFAGCGSGRDMQEAVRKGFTCVGIDISTHMLNIGKIIGLNSPLIYMDIEKMDFPDNSFDGIFCDTAITHIKKKGIEAVISDFKRLLAPGGVLFVSFRKGDGMVYMTDDKVGKRYYMTTTPKRADRYLTEAGFEIISKSSHKIGLRPAYYNLLAINKK